jgi:heavy metal translocating P-type ATPase
MYLFLHKKTRRRTMRHLAEYFTDEAKFRLVRIGFSGIALVMSLLEWTVLPGGLDMAWIAILLCGVPIITGAVKALVTKHDITADVLVSLALIGSLIAGEFFAAGEVAFIMEIGSALEDYTSAKARKGIEGLMNLMPKLARVRRNGEEKRIPVEDIKKGDTVIVLAGETIPTDGTIIKGVTSLDQSAMTGESLPVDKTVGDDVLSGSLNKENVFEYVATAEAANSALQRMIDLAQKADENKAPIVSLADQWAAWLVIAAFAAAVLTFLLNWFILGNTSGAFLRAVTVLIVVCPCAFILATPTAIIAGIGNAAKYGMIIKSGESLQRLSTIDTVAFDKTGTLTYGKLSVEKVRPFTPEYSEKDILKLAAIAEALSEHPIGKAICAAANTDEQASSYTIFSGKGIAATYKGQKLLAGKKEFFLEKGIFFDPKWAHDDRFSGSTVVYLAVDGNAVGVLSLTDTIRENAEPTIKKLLTMHIEPVLLTGDNPQAAKKIADAVHIANYRSGLLPEDKQKFIREYQKTGHKVCMIGDGINDAVALRTADSAIAMGGIGSDITIESSDVVLVQDDISRIPYLLHLSQKVLQKIQANIVLSLIINLIATILAATGVLNPIVGALVHNVGSVFVVVNSLRLLSLKEDM